jgi:deazaflavin-dependent oxidoreductase (nitroreductase family)
MASWAERHLVNRAVRIGVRLGRDIDGIRELEVVGRRSGKLRRTPVKVVELGDERYVVSLSGPTGWARNLRERRRARLRFGRHSEDVVATEIPDEDKPPIARAYLQSATRPETLRQLAWAAEGTPAADVRRGAAGIPVFRLTVIDALSRQ